MGSVILALVILAVGAALAFGKRPVFLPSGKRRPSLYFAHPINTYGTDLERTLLEGLARRFPGHRIVNPGGAEHQVKYQEYMARGAKEMDYFIDLVNGCDKLVLLAFPDGMIGAGVYKEAIRMDASRRPVWEISPRADLNAWSPDPKRALSIEATIARIRMPDPQDPSKTIRKPYFDA